MKFNDYINQKLRSKNIPGQVSIEITEICNLDCEHCYLDKQKTKYMGKEQLKRLLNVLKSMGVLSVQFTGGEPFLHPHIVEILNYAVDLGLLVIVQTNGTMLTPDLLACLSRGFSMLKISLYSLDDEVHDKITRKKSLSRILKNIELLKSKDIPITIATSVMKRNFVDVEKIYKWSEQEGFTFTSTSLIAPSLDQKNIGEYRVNPDILVANESQWNGQRTICGISSCKTANDFLFSNCSGGISSCYVNIDFRIQLCAFLQYPEIPIDCRENFQQAWIELNKFRMTVQPRESYECLNCQYINYCDRCPGINYMETGCIDGHIDFVCDVAKERYKVYQNESL